MTIDETDFRKGVAHRVRASILYAFAYHWPVPDAGLDQASCLGDSGWDTLSPVFAPTPGKDPAVTPEFTPHDLITSINR